MKKKILVALACVSLTTFLAGCGEAYPKISIYCSYFNGVDDEVEISIGSAYKYKSFEKENTSDGCAVTIYFENTKNK